MTKAVAAAAAVAVVAAVAMVVAVAVPTLRLWQTANDLLWRIATQLRRWRKLWRRRRR